MRRCKRRGNGKPPKPSSVRMPLELASRAPTRRGFAGVASGNRAIVGSPSSTAAHLSDAGGSRLQAEFRRAIEKLASISLTRGYAHPLGLMIYDVPLAFSTGPT